MGLDHPGCAAGQVDADDGRQELWGQPHRQGQGEQHGIQQVAVEKQVKGEDGQDHHQGELHEEVAETAHPPLELGLRRAQPQPLGDLPELGLPSRERHQGGGRAAHHVGAHE